MSDNVPTLCGNCFHQHTCWIKKKFSEFVYDGNFHNHIDVIDFNKDLDLFLAKHCKYYVLHTLLADCTEGYWNGIGEG